MNTKNVHKRGTEAVYKKLQSMGIDCEINLENKVDENGLIYDISARKNEREIKIRVCATLANDTKYKYSLNEHQNPHPKLYYAFVYLKKKGKSEIMPFSSEYVFYHPCRANKKTGPQCFYFYVNYNGHNMRDDYEMHINRFSIFNKYFKRRKKTIVREVEPERNEKKEYSDSE
jgi:hypothetical protein